MVSLDRGLLYGLTRVGMMKIFLSWVHSVERKSSLLGWNLNDWKILQLLDILAGCSKALDEWLFVKILSTGSRVLCFRLLVGSR